MLGKFIIMIKLVILDDDFFIFVSVVRYFWVGILRKKLKRRLFNCIIYC